MNKYHVIKDCVINHKFYQCGTVYTDPYLVVNKQYLKVLLEHNFIKPMNNTKAKFKQWENTGVRSKLANIIVAPEDYIEGDKKHFTYEEALAIEKKLNNGWRLPTRSEWVLIAEEFGQNPEGKLDKDKLMRKLHLSYTGRVYDGSLYDTSGGFWWSSTAYSATSAYYLYIDSSNVSPGTYKLSRHYGFAVRLVKDIK